jgi:hypothetical protein
MPYVWQEERGTHGDEPEEEDDYGEMLLIHEVVAQPGGTISDAAVGELDIEGAECIWYAVDKQSVQEAYGSVSASVNSASRRVNMAHTGRLASVQRKL